MIPFFGFYIQFDVKCEDCKKSLFKEPEDKPTFTNIDLLKCQECLTFHCEELLAKHEPELDIEGTDMPGDGMPF